MKIVKGLRKATQLQIQHLSPREVANVIATVATTRTPALLQKATMWPMGSRRHAKGAPVATILNGCETIASFLSRGGSIVTCAPTRVIEPTVRVKGSRNMANTQMRAKRAVMSIDHQ
jgi:hypothetical protein